MDAGITHTRTKADWCLKEGLLHVCSVNGGNLLPLVERHGPPTYYHSLAKCRHTPPSPTDNMKAPSTAFQSLCRIVAGQQLAGAAAQAVYKRLLETTEHSLTPATIISLASNGGLVDRLQKPSGLSNAKARSILALAEQFSRGDLSEDFLNDRVRGLHPRGSSQSAGGRTMVMRHVSHVCVGKTQCFASGRSGSSQGYVPTLCVARKCERGFIMSQEGSRTHTTDRPAL